MHNGARTEASTEGSAEQAPQGVRPAAEPLLEREGELAQLGAALAEARGGGGQALLIEGPAGIGKTRLLSEASAAAAAQGLRVLVARGGELERDFGFGVVRQLLEPVLAHAGRAERRELLAGAAGLAETVFAPPDEEVVATDDTTHAVLHGLYWLVSNLAERTPLLLAIDDAHWADGPSQRFLLHLSRRLDGIGAAVLITTRTGERGTEPELLQALMLEASPTVLRPDALSEEAVRSIVEARLGQQVDGALSRACYEATCGNPFLLVEVLQELGSGERRLAEVEPEAVSRLGSSRIAAAILFRVGRLERSAPALARAIAVLGETASLPRAAALAGLERSTAASLADSLVEARVLEPGSPLRFVHPVVRTAIYKEIPAAERTEMHAGAARLLAEEGAEPGVVAVHLLATRPADRPQVVDVLRAAARSALSRGSPETAVRYLRRALEEPPPDALRPELALELGAAAARAGEPDGLDLLRGAFAAAAEQPLRATAGLLLGGNLIRAGASLDEAIEALDLGLEGLEDPGRAAPLEAMLLLAGITTPAAHARVRGRLGEARSRIEQVPLDRVRPLLSPLAGDVLVSDGDAAGAARLAEQALAGGTLLREEITTGMPLTAPAALTLVFAGRLEAADRAAGVLIDGARAHGSLGVLARACAFRGFCRYRMGDLGAAEADARNCMELGSEPGQGIPGPLAVATLIGVLVERADPGAARDLLRHVDAGVYDPEVFPIQPLRESRAKLLIAQGEPQAALEELRACGRWEEQWGARAGVEPVAWRSAAALASATLGDAAEAGALAEQGVELARRFGVPGPIGVALRALGLLEGGEHGAELLEQAVSVLEGSGARLEHARALVDLGAALRRLGRRSAAVERLRQGMDAAHRCGAIELVRFAREELRLAGARPGRIALTGRDALTPAERRVADLAAEGLRNKEIAQAQFVTLRTVEMHLTNAYRKLGISSREGLPAALRDGSGRSGVSPADRPGTRSIR
jgi:DNA-binding CsgD family transcriptional regulator